MNFAGCVAKNKPFEISRRKALKFKHLLQKGGGKIF